MVAFARLFAKDLSGLTTHMDEPVITIYEEAPAECLDYDARARDVALIVASLITGRLPEVTVEHIGSTSVPGCAGKGVVDLMITYPAGRLEAVRQLLDELGFQRQTTRDPFPEDRPLRLGAIEHQGKRFRLHVHVINETSEEAARLRAFRDLLRSDEKLRARYIARKREIIGSGVTDTVDYSVEKGAFIERALAQQD